uniref:Uncharacterized protein n=1 Tax=Meloidogyne enterolobii TaxID=390850 RepID=A0A6V7VNJ6_MELEN|nr:unnamed protein product [Meloidogyne enterolobii]
MNKLNKSGAMGCKIRFVCICLMGINKFQSYHLLHNSERHRTILQLPTIIKNKNSIKIAYYYLNKLFNCSFERGYCYEFIFNPELIELLFGRTPKQQFFIESFYKVYNTKNLLKFVLNHLISNNVKINFPHVNNTEEYKDILSKILMNGDKFKGVGLLFHNRFIVPELFDFIINQIETSKDCSKMVDFININRLSIEYTGLNGKAEKIEEQREYGNLIKAKYQISNKFNPKIKFSIVYKIIFETVKEIKIQRIY